MEPENTVRDGIVILLRTIIAKTKAKSGRLGANSMISLDLFSVQLLSCERSQNLIIRITPYLLVLTEKSGNHHQFWLDNTGLVLMQNG